MSARENSSLNHTISLPTPGSPGVNPLEGSEGALRGLNIKITRWVTQSVSGTCASTFAQMNERAVKVRDLRGGPRVT